MPEILKKYGYYTVAAHPDKGLFWNWMPALSSMGFNKCIDFSQVELTEVFPIGPSDSSFLKQMSDKMKGYKQPFYSFNITLTSHMPFILPDNYKKLNLDPEFDKTYLGGYFQCINYTDRAIGEFIESLKQNNLLDNSLLVIYGDHQGVHRFYPEEIKKITPKEDWWQENNKQVPFIIYNPS
ncbi:LTA synthase family protein, partial [Cutibacterium acnes]